MLVCRFATAVRNSYSAVTTTGRTGRSMIETARPAGVLTPGRAVCRRSMALRVRLAALCQVAPVRPLRTAVASVGTRSWRNVRLELPAELHRPVTSCTIGSMLLV